MHSVSVEQYDQDGEGLPRDSELLDDACPQRAIQLEHHWKHNEKRQRDAVHVNVTRVVPTERKVTEREGNEISKSSREKEVVEAYQNPQNQTCDGAYGLDVQHPLHLWLEFRAHLVVLCHSLSMREVGAICTLCPRSYPCSHCLCKNTWARIVRVKCNANHISQ